MPKKDVPVPPPPKKDVPVLDLFKKDVPVLDLFFHRPPQLACPRPINLGIFLALGMTFFMASLTVAGKFFPQADTIKATYLSAFMGALIMLLHHTYLVTHR